MKNLLFSIAAATTLALANMIPARATLTCHSSGDLLYHGSVFSYNRRDFNPWEHPFGCDNNISRMPQWMADAYCNNVFDDYAEGKFFATGKSLHSSHVWAHLNDRVCVYNNQ